MKESMTPLLEADEKTFEQDLKEGLDAWDRPEAGEAEKTTATDGEVPVEQEIRDALDAWDADEK